MSINLLPWRKTRSRKAKLKFAILAAMILILSLPFTLNIYFRNLQEKKAEEIMLQSLQSKILMLSNSLNPKIAENYQNLRNQIRQISELKKKRIAILKKFSDLIQKTPPGISLKTLSLSETESEIEGFSNRKEALEGFIRNLSRLFKNWKSTLKIDEDSNAIQFKISLRKAQ